MFPCSKAVTIIYSDNPSTVLLPLPYIEKVIQLRRLDLVDRELFSKQSRELSEKGDVTIGKSTEPF